MTRKLLLPTRLERMQIRRDHVHDPTPSQPSKNTETNDVKGLQQDLLVSSLDDPPLQHDSRSIVDHNRHCEETENSTRLEQWIHDQQAHQQDGAAQENSADLASSSSTGHTEAPPPTPPALPPRPAIPQTEPPQSSALSQREALLQQIREVVGKRVSQITSNEDPALRRSLDFSTSHEAAIAPETSPVPNSDTKEAAWARSGSLYPSIGRDASPQPVTAAPSHPVPTDIQMDSHAWLEKAGWDSHEQPPPALTDSWEKEEPSFQAPRPGPPPVPPKPEAARAASTSNVGNKDLSPTNPYYSKLNRTSLPPLLFTPRIFTSNCGAFRVEAELLDWKDGKVWLRKGNGVKISVPLSRFSGVDVEFILTEMMRRAEQRRVNAGLQAARDERSVPCGIELGLESELEKVYAVAI